MNKPTQPDKKSMDYLLTDIQNLVFEELPDRGWGENVTMSEKLLALFTESLKEMEQTRDCKAILTCGCHEYIKKIKELERSSNGK